MEKEVKMPVVSAKRSGGKKDLFVTYIETAFNYFNDPEADIPQSKVAALQCDILKYFGLPPAFQYLHILFKYSNSISNLQADAARMHRDLKKAAEEWLLGPVKTNQELLRLGKKYWREAEEVLLLMGMVDTKYRGFLLHDVYYRGMCNEHELLAKYAHLKEADPDDEYVPDTFVHFDGVYDYLEHEMNLPYLMEYGTYLEYLKEEQPWEAEITNDLLDEVLNTAVEFSLNEFIITRVGTCRKEKCVFEILAPLNNNYIKLTVRSTFDKFFNLVLHSRYLSLACAALKYLRPEFINEYTGADGFVDLGISVGMRLEVINYEIKLKRGKGGYSL